MSRCFMVFGAGGLFYIFNIVDKTLIVFKRRLSSAFYAAALRSDMLFSSKNKKIV